MGVSARAHLFFGQQLEQKPGSDTIRLRDCVGLWLFVLPRGDSRAQKGSGPRSGGGRDLDGLHIAAVAATPGAGAAERWVHVP